MQNYLLNAILTSASAKRGYWVEEQDITKWRSQNVQESKKSESFSYQSVHFHCLDVI